MPQYKTKTPTKDGRSWFFKVNYKDSLGNIHAKVSQKYSTKTEAKDAERRFLNSVKDKKLVPTKMTLGDLWDDWMVHQDSRVKVSTKNNYKQTIPYIEMLFNIKCHEFSLQQFEDWKSNLVSRNDIKTVTKNDRLKTFRALLNYGRRTYDFQFNRILGTESRIKEPNKVKELHNVYTPEDFQIFISGESDLRFICLWKMLYYCGLRIGEARGLQWKDIYWNVKTVWVNKQVQSYNNYSASFYITSLKSTSSDRKLTLCESLLEDLEKYHNQIKKYKNYSDEFFIFGDSGGLIPISYNKCRRRKKTIASKVPVHEIRLHDFRHSCASLLINNGAPITMVSKYMGHASITETLNTYSHMFGSDFQSITNLIDKINTN